jgi:hypothetical protein
MTASTGRPKLDTTILPIYQEYVKLNPGLTLWNYLGMRADYDLAAAFTSLFWPDFIEVDGCILLNESHSPANFEQWKEHFQGDRRSIEQMLNHTHMYDLFMNSETVLNRPTDSLYSPALYEYLAQTLVVCWKHALQETFPDKKFAFSYATDPDEYGPTISFWQEE